MILACIGGMSTRELGENTSHQRYTGICICLYGSLLTKILRAPRAEMPDIRVKTERLELVASTVDLARAELRDRAEFVRLIGARLPDDWPPVLNDEQTMAFNLKQLERGPRQVGWWCWYFVFCGESAGDRVLVGVGGFKGRPDKTGTVEVGYSILENYQCRGYCTEAVGGLIGWAFGHNQVRTITAQTLPHLTPSIRVLEKLGFSNVGLGNEEGAIRFDLTREAQRD